MEPARRPPVIGLHFHEGTGCAESMLRAEHAKAGMLTSLAKITVACPRGEPEPREVS